MNIRKGPSKPLNRAVNNLQGKLKNSFLYKYPHWIIPGYNLNINPSVENYDEDHIMQLFKEFPYDTDLPKPLLPPARLPQSVLRNNDPALQLLTVKSEIKDDIKRITEHHEKYRKDLTICHKKNLKWTTNGDNTKSTLLPRYVAELAEIMELDPDPDFTGEYNWYYTGGSLNHLVLSDVNILLFPYVGELVAAPIIHRPDSSLWKPNLNNAAKCSVNSTLYEIRHTITSGHMCRILGRHKFSCDLYWLSEVQGELELEVIDVQLSDSPIISVDLSPIEPNKYCRISGKRCVEFRDFSKLKPLSSISMPKATNLPDQWMSIKFNQSDPHIVAISDRCCLHYIDLRTPSDGPNLTLCPRKNLEICESISLNFPSNHNSFHQYLGTYHSLILCDSRYANSCVVQKWTHQFKSPPLFSATVERNEEEIITLSSQFSGENSVIINNWTSDSQAYSYSMPYMPLSISETLRACQDEGKCLDPSMRNRLDLCNAGTTVNLNDSNDVTFFTQNSIGDVFYQCITRDKMLGIDSAMNKKSLRALNAWEDAYLKQSKTVKPLVLSDNVNMSHVLKGMKNSAQCSKNEELKILSYVPKWFQSVEKLGSYIDILAPQLLSVWDVNEDAATQTVTPHEKVLTWLEQEPSSQNLNQSQEDPPMFNDSNQISSQELISVSQNIQMYDTQNDIVEENEIVYDTLVVDATRKKSVRKKKYIAGF